MSKVGVIGGAGSIGKVVVKYFQDNNYQVYINDPKSKDSLELNQLLDQCKLIYISVFPLEATKEILKKIITRADANEFIILENNSLKQLMEPEFLELDNLGASLCATHPLCKADQPWKNQNVILIPFGKHSRAALCLAKELYQCASMKIHQLNSFKEHDKLMCVFQLVPHLVMRIVAQLYSDLKLDWKLLEELATANFKLFNLSLWRVLVQSPELSASIIHNLLEQAEGEKIYKNLLNKLQNVQNYSLKELTNVFTNFYTDFDKWKQYQSKMNQKSIVTLERLVNIEEQSISIYSNKNEVGLLRKILAAFEKLNINITAIDSHMEQDTLRFDIGFDKSLLQSELTQLKALLTQLGHKFEMSS